MSFGKIHSAPNNVRTISILYAARVNSISLEFVPQKTGLLNASPAYLSLNPQGKIPTFEGQDGLVLTECIAITLYLTSLNSQTTLLGSSKTEYHQIISWMSFANSEIPPTFGRWFRPLLGLDPYDANNVAAAERECLQKCMVLEKHLAKQKEKGEGRLFLMGNRLSIADVFVAGVLNRGFEYLFARKWREQHPCIVEWYVGVTDEEGFRAVSIRPAFREEVFEPVVR